MKILNEHIVSNIKNYEKSANGTNNNNVSTSAASQNNNHNDNWSSVNTSTWGDCNNIVSNQKIPLFSGGRGKVSNQSNNHWVNNKNKGRGGADIKNKINDWCVAHNGKNNNNRWGGKNNNSKDINGWNSFFHTPCLHSIIQPLRKKKHVQFLK